MNITDIKIGNQYYWKHRLWPKVNGVIEVISIDQKENIYFTPMINQYEYKFLNEISILTKINKLFYNLL